jgi:hypothetical protein
MGLYDDPRFKRAFPNMYKPFWNPKGIPSRIAKGLGRDIPKMWDNAHPAAKACLIVAGGISASPFVEAGVAYNNRNPENLIDFINGFNDRGYDYSKKNNIPYNAGQVSKWLTETF